MWMAVRLSIKLFGTDFRVFSKTDLQKQYVFANSASPSIGLEVQERIPLVPV